MKIDRPAAAVRYGSSSRPESRTLTFASLHVFRNAEFPRPIAPPHGHPNSDTRKSILRIRSRCCEHGDVSFFLFSSVARTYCSVNTVNAARFHSAEYWKRKQCDVNAKTSQQFSKFLRRNSESASTGSLIDSRFSLRIANSISLVNSRRSIHLLTVGERRNQVVWWF